MYSILLSLFPLISLILSGYFLKQKNFLNDGFWVGAEKLNYYILFPAMLFGNLASATIELHLVKTIGLVLLGVLSIVYML